MITNLLLSQAFLHTSRDFSLFFFSSLFLEPFLCRSLSFLDTLFRSLSLTFSFSFSLSLSLSLSLHSTVFCSLSLFSPLFHALSLSPSPSLPLSLPLSLLSLFIHVHILMDVQADVERGVAEEHLLQPDSKKGFTSNNYGVRYFIPVCNKQTHQTQFLSSLFDVLK
jgi:hypothetical protein